MAEHAASDRLAALCRLILVFRLLALLLVLVYPLGQEGSAPVVLAAVVVGLVTSYVPLRRWERLAPTLEAHPALLGIDLLVAQAILLATGVHGPFFLFTLSSALLGGVLYGARGAGVFTAVLLACYYAIVAVRAPRGLEVLDFDTLVGAPVLYPFAAAGGAAIRRLLDREAWAQSSLSAERERSRVAREMHDSLGKTLYGLALSANAVAAHAQRSPERAADQARALAAAAQAAGDQARALIGGLRADQPTLALPQAVRTRVEEWSRQSAVPVVLDLDEHADGAPDARYELFAILDEALENVRRHAGARSVRVALGRAGGDLSLRVSDDGVGVPMGSLRELEPAGHFGLVGMRERAERIGGSLRLEPGEDGGTTVTASVPAAPERAEPAPV